MRRDDTLIDQARTSMTLASLVLCRVLLRRSVGSPMSTKHVMDDPASSNAGRCATTLRFRGVALPRGSPPVLSAAQRVAVRRGHQVCVQRVQSHPSLPVFRTPAADGAESGHSLHAAAGYRDEGQSALPHELRRWNSSPSSDSLEQFPHRAGDAASKSSSSGSSWPDAAPCHGRLH